MIAECGGRRLRLNRRAGARLPGFRCYSAAMRGGWFLLVRCLPVAVVLSCSSPIHRRPDATAVDTIAAHPDTSTVPDLRLPGDTAWGVDGLTGNGCAKQTLYASHIPVRGTVVGPKVDGTICENGMGTSFLGPQDTDHQYYQGFSTTTWLNAPYSPNGRDMSQIYGFLMRKPTDAQSAVLSGDVGASAAAVGTYDSNGNCGYLDFEVTRPIPPGVICKAQFPPCDPGCEPEGELVLCRPANVRSIYSARPAASCREPDVPAQGSWVLTLSSVSPYIPSDTFLHHTTHGNLTATLINRADPSDSVVFDLDF